MSSSVPKQLQDCIRAVRDNLDSDLYLFSADIEVATADTLIQLIRCKSSRRDNAVLILATYGGDPDAAYRIARALKQSYKKFTLFVFGYCKSAGTLIAIGADEIIMSDFAELGPLDVQVLKENDFRRSSGLDLQQSLSVIGEEMFSIFEKCFLETIYKSGGVISTQMATEVASSMAVGILSPVTSQIDPLKIGELSRSIKVAYEYGIRLNPSIESSIQKLVSAYPSHSFVIDREEAKELFRVVRNPTDKEMILEVILYECVRSPASQKLILTLDNFLDDVDESIESEDFCDEPEESDEIDRSDKVDGSDDTEEFSGEDGNGKLATTFS